MQAEFVLDGHLEAEVASLPLADSESHGGMDEIPLLKEIQDVLSPDDEIQDVLVPQPEKTEPGSASEVVVTAKDPKEANTVKSGPVPATGQLPSLAQLGEAMRHSQKPTEATRPTQPAKLLLPQEARVSRPAARGNAGVLPLAELGEKPSGLQERQLVDSHEAGDSQLVDGCDGQPVSRMAATGNSMTTELDRCASNQGGNAACAPQASLSATRVLTQASNQVENDRQLRTLDSTQAQQRAQQAKNSYLVQAKQASSSGMFAKTLGVFTDMVGLTTNAAASDEERVTEIVVGETLPIHMTESQAREMRCKLSTADPTLDPFYVNAFHQYIAGCPLAEMRSKGCTMKHLVGIGVCYDDWTYKSGFGLREVAMLDGDWAHVVAMGFVPQHITERERNGPTLLRDPPFSVQWDDLEYDIGLTVDEAVFVYGFTSADFAIFGENLNDLIRRGFGPQHVDAMGEPKSNFEMILKATHEDLRILFPNQSKLDSHFRATGANGNDASRTFSKLTHVSAPLPPSNLLHERGTDAIDGVSLRGNGSNDPSHAVGNSASSGKAASAGLPTTYKEQRAYMKIHQATPGNMPNNTTAASGSKYRTSFTF